MKIDLSRKEIEIINDALLAWQTQPISEGLNSSIMGAVLSRGSDDSVKTDFRKEAFSEVTKAQQESRRREREAVLLRAKLIQTENASSEHEESSRPATPPRRLMHEFAAN